MRIFKKILFISLAVAPVISFIIAGLTFFGLGQNPLFFESSIDFDIFTIHSVFIEDIGDSYSWSYVFPDGASSVPGLLDLLFTFNTGGINSNGNFMLGGLYLLQQSGVIITTPMIFASYLFVYYFAVSILSLIWDLITFVPRKCSEIFQ